MEDTEGALSMQRQRRHVHEEKCKDVDRSEHSVRVRPFGQQENGGTRA